ncbi:hypothetical protein ACIQGO_17765 [Streptomyces shenzhenensis]|uniref:hypothetical protein n=1 Tax=Streptomyces shenzhenensis TaxID=943815 RepID=UPI0038142764
MREPEGELDRRYSSAGADAVAWSEAEAPLPAVWADGSLHFCTGARERKARNLERNPEVDLVVEGTAVRVADDGRLRELAAAWEAKYGAFWHFEVRATSWTVTCSSKPIPVTARPSSGATQALGPTAAGPSAPLT